MRAISLFSGVGGFELGFGPSGVETVLQAEINSWCLGVLRHRFPGIPKLDDVRVVRPSTLGLERIDLVYGGFPCQDASVEGLGRGFDGERTSLWWEFIRIIDDTRIPWLVAENVPGLLSVNNGEDFRAVIRSLDERGYGVAWRVLDARGFGIPQKRRRLIVVAALGSADAAGLVLDVGSDAGRYPAPSGEAESHPAPRPLQRAEAEPAPIIYQCHGNNVGPVGTLRAGNGGVTGGNPFLVVDRQGRPVDRRVDPSSELYARTMTPVERERGMGWPDDWTRYADTAGGTVEVPRSRRVHMTGNGMAAPMARWLAERLRLVAADSDATLSA